MNQEEINVNWAILRMNISLYMRELESKGHKYPSIVRSVNRKFNSETKMLGREQCELWGMKVKP